MNKLHVGVVIPVLSAFKECVKALTHIKSENFWQPYIAPQWENNRAISAVWNEYSVQAFKDGCDYVLILNDDAFLFPWALDAMIKELQRVPSLFLVSGEDTHKEHDVHPAEELKEANLNYSCFLIKPGIFELFGYFDENFYPAFFEDNDFHYRMRLLNYPSYGISTGQFYHLHSTTANHRINSIGQQAFEDFRANRKYYINKWGGPPGEETFKHPYDNPSMSPRDWMPIRR